MKIKLLAIFVMFILIFSCQQSVKKTDDLKIDYQLNISEKGDASYFTFKGPIRYMEADKDANDAKTGASTKGSTKFFQAYRYDVKGKNTLPDGLRGLFLFAVAPFSQLKTDNFTISKDADGSITVQYVHRGTAYFIKTDATGKISFDDKSFKKRAVGFIKGEEPQVIHKDFSEDGTAAKIDWKKVWDTSIPGGKDIAEGVKNKTGNVVADIPAKDALYYWDGTLQATFENNVLKINGVLSAMPKK